jgi:hypothetical protein
MVHLVAFIRRSGKERSRISLMAVATQSENVTIKLIRKKPTEKRGREGKNFMPPSPYDESTFV